MNRSEAVLILERARAVERANVQRLRREIERLQDEVRRSWGAVTQLSNDWPRVSLDRLGELVEEYGNTPGRWVEVVEDGDGEIGTPEGGTDGAA